MQFQVLEIYNILTSPYPIKSREVCVLLGCARNKAVKELRNAQNMAIEKGYRFNSDDLYVSPEQWLDYIGWDFKKIERDALNLLAVLSQKKSNSGTV